MNTIFRRLLGVLAILPALAAGVAAGRPVAEQPNVPMVQIRQAVVSIRTLVGNGTEPVSTGSGFFVGATGRLVTNHHVVGLALRKPSHYRIQLKLPGGATATAQIVGFSLADDLAVLQLSTPLPAGMTWIGLAKSLPTPKDGSAIYAFGDASGMGVVSTRGHYSGLLDKAGFERYHFTGTLNPGMSGGPAVDQRGQLIGVNAARRTDAEQMSFLVPAARVHALVARTAQSSALDPAAVAAEVRRQLEGFHAQLAQVALSGDQTSARYGPYRVPEFGGARLKCGPINDASADDRDEPRPTEVQGATCRMVNSLDWGDDIIIGHVEYSHRHFRAMSLNGWRFNTAMDNLHRQRLGESASNVMAAAQCVDKFTRSGRDGRLPVRLTWCTQAYREFEGVYDVWISVLTRDRPNEALLSKLQIYGVSWAQAQAYTRRLLEGIE